MPNILTQEARDSLLLSLTRSCTNLKEDDIQILLEIAHALPCISNLENGDTYINVLTKSGESMVIAQYRHPHCDLYQRDIIGEMENKTDEPAVYRALEYGLSCRGRIGIIDKGSVIVRHTVTPIYNREKIVIGSLTYEYPDCDGLDTEPIRIQNLREDKSDYFEEQIDKVSDYLQDGLLTFDENGVCTFGNAKAEELYQKTGFEGSVIGRHYDDLHLMKLSMIDVITECNVIKSEIHMGDYTLEESVSTIWEDGIYQGIAVILQDKTKIRQMEEEIATRIAAVNEVHHRVKNNLQTVISLVGLEAMQSKNEEVKAFSKTIVSRICSISVLYDLLSHTGKDSVNLKIMLMRVVEGSLGGINAGSCRISTHIDGNDLDLEANMASTVALVVNELTQNSLKYAFQGYSEGDIWLTIERGEEYSWVTVRDNGCGFNDETKKQPGSGLGLKLVDNLVKSSLKGEISITSTRGEGTVAKFSFRTKETAAADRKIFHS